MDDIVGILFCGGKGTRMRPLTYYIQKVMMPIGKDQKPILEYVIKHFKRHNITNLILLVNYKREQIRGYFEDGSHFGVNIEYVVDKPGPVGTGTALLNASETIDKRRVFVYYSDIITNANFTDMIKYHKSHGKWASILISKGWKLRVGTAKTNEKGQILEFVEKPTLDMHINTGISILEPKVFEYLSKFDSSESIDLSKNIFPEFVKEQQMMGYAPGDFFWEDIGSMERYEKINHERITQLMKK